MAVYKRRYQGYLGGMTNPRWRFLVLTRFAFSQLFQYKLFILFFVAAFIAPLVGAILVYLHYNTMGLQFLQEAVENLVPIDAEFFHKFMISQTILGVVLTAFVGPGLVSPDLANSALPLYLSRPFTRTEYVLGKMTVLMGLFSVLTWIPLMGLYFFQVSLAGLGWMWENWRIGFGIMAGSWAWILVISLLALAFSAWVKWRPLAGLLIFVYIFVSAGIAEAVNNMAGIREATVLNVAQLIRIIWETALFSEARDADLPFAVAVVCLLAQCGFFLYLLSRKIRAYEVVR